ncbi:MAG: DUF1553 domain-containing protein [Fimbriimonas sp.]|nr:DUF1553 domain-containing protein [Fimbriimonas sp.]
MKVQRWISNLGLLAASSGLLMAALIAPTQTAPSKPTVNFSRDVLPILSDKCFKCHGPDAQGRQANMRLDVSEGAFENRSGRFPIVPGHPEHSMVVKRITSTNDPMPPAYSGKSLTKGQIATLTEWVAEGAKYDRLWSFEPVPEKVSVPTVSSAWPKNDIDRFVLVRLQREKLMPSGPAPKDRLLRRVTLDLTGLPPTEAEIRAFESDKREGAYERVVDRLLASPHFGERAAVDWLDAARYSDSYGYQSDLLSPTWPYRDWVVKAFNQNMPYNRFLTEQIAGDLLPRATRDQRLATAFNRLHRQSNEGGSIALEFKTTYADDRVDTFGSAVLGLTIGCARCHDHKFDPITQREYYQFFAYFNSIDEYGLLLSTEIVPSPSMLLPTPEQDSRLALLRDADRAAKTQLAADAASAKSRFVAWRGHLPTDAKIPDLAARFTLKNERDGKFADELGGKSYAEKIGPVQEMASPKGNCVVLDGDNGFAIRGLPGKERWDAFTWSFWINDVARSSKQVVLLQRTGGTDVGFCGFDLLLDDGYLTARVMRAWPGNSVAVRSKKRVPQDEWTHVAWSWDGSGDVSGLKLYIDGHSVDTTILESKLWKKIDAYGDLGDSRGDWTFGQRFRDAGLKGGRLADIAFATRALSDLEVADLGDHTSLANAIKSPDAHTPELVGYYASAIDPEVRSARQKVHESQTNLTNFEEGIYEVEVMEETPKPIPAYVLARGNYDAPRNAKTLVVRDVPKSLPPLHLNGSNTRLALAQWVTDPNHPLTARVAVNRIWQMLFGVGIVETSENFGVQGARPSHLQLLNYLARRFVDSGWDIKALVRTIVLSATYRQESTHTQKLNAIDPDNHLLARGPSRRLPAEMIRDTALAAAGLMNDKVGGPPVNPYQPAGLWRENNAFSPEFVQSKGADLYRRSIYSTWKRTTPVPSMLLFDATSREACSIRRPVTNTPLQALVMLNDVQFVEAARVLAELVLKRHESDGDRIRDAFVRLSGRRPDARESAILLETFADQRKQFASTPSDAAKLVKMGDAKADPEIPVVDLAAMTVTVQEILSSDAVVWKR